MMPPGMGKLRSTRPARVWPQLTVAGLLAGLTALILWSLQ